MLVCISEIRKAKEGSLAFVKDDLKPPFKAQDILRQSKQGFVSKQRWKLRPCS